MSECADCGSSRVVYDCAVSEFICTSCGVCQFTDCEFLPNLHKPSNYKRDTYFMTLIQNAQHKGAPITSDTVESLCALFHQSARLFQEHKQEMGRQNYPYLSYALFQLGMHLGLDLRPFIKLPKMKSTLAAAERDWALLDPR